MWRAAAAGAVVGAVAVAAQPWPWLNTSLPYSNRTAALIAALTLPEKIGLSGNAQQAVPRLGIPAYDTWSEALHGVAWAGAATVFPQSLGMAATWDAPLMASVGSAIAVEGRAKHLNASAGTNASGQFFGLHFETPNINLVRDVRWGRSMECIGGEDPTLAGVMGSAMIRGLQFGDDPRFLKAVAQSKHFLAYSLDSVPGQPQVRVRA